MEYRPMYEEPGIFETGELNEAKECTQEKVRFVLHAKRLKTLPAGYEAAAHIPHLELDLSYNSALQHRPVIDALAPLKNLKGLGMTKTNMEELPENISLLQNLEALEVTGNRLKTLPESIQELRQLKLLNLRTNRFTTFPKMLLSMGSLRSLNLRYNEIKTLPKDLSPFAALEILNLSDNGISTLPPAVKDLVNLRELHLNCNKLTLLPEELGTLQQLETLSLNGHPGLNLDQTCQVLAACKKLKYLRLEDCDLTALPPSIALLEQLERIDLKGNRFASLPDVLLQLKHLHEIKFDGDMPAAFYFNMIKDKPDISELSTGKVQPYLENGKQTLPESIGELKHLTFLPVDGLELLPAAVGSLSQLKALHLNGGSYAALPDLSGLVSLEEISFSYINTLKELPDFVYRLPALKELHIYKSSIAPDYARLAQMSSLETLIADNITNDDLLHFRHSTSIRQVEFEGRPVALPDAYFDIPGIRTFDFGKYPQLDTEATMLQLKRLPGLRAVRFSREQPRTFEWYVTWLKTMPLLKEATIFVSEIAIPESLLDLHHLDKVRLMFQLPVSSSPVTLQLPLWLANTKNGQLVFSERADAAPAKKAFELIAAWDIKEPLRRQIAFGLIARLYEGLHQLLPYPFDTDGNIPDANVYLVGKPTLSTRKELETLLKNRGANIVKELDKATHILLGQDAEEIVISSLFDKDYIFILEDHLKQQEIKDDTPFLMAAENQELTRQITALLKAEHEDNIALILQLIEGGGAGRTLLSYLAAIHLFHEQPDIRKKSRALFRKYATATLQHHFKSKWKASYLNKEEDSLQQLLLHAELDVCAFILAVKMIRRRQPDGERRFTSLSLRGIPVSSITESLADLDFIEHLSLEAPGAREIDNIVQWIGHFPLKYLAVTAPLTLLPPALVTMPSLKQLHIAAYGAPAITIPELDAATATIQYLVISGCSLLYPERLTACRQLTQLSLNYCGLEDIGFIASLTSLELLHLYRNRITALPGSFNQLQQLQHLDLSYNQLGAIDFDFGQLKKLRNLNLANAGISAIRDCFYQVCLEHIYLNNNELTELPLSLFVSLAGCSGRQDIDASGNKITAVAGTVPAGWETLLQYRQLYNFRLNNNQLSALPAVLEKIPEISNLYLHDNVFNGVPAGIENIKAASISLNIKETDKAVAIPLQVFSLMAASLDIHIDANTRLILPSPAMVPEQGKKVHLRQHNNPALDAFNAALSSKR